MVNNKEDLSGSGSIKIVGSARAKVGARFGVLTRFLCFPM